MIHFDRKRMIGLLLAFALLLSNFVPAVQAAESDMPVPSGVAVPAVQVKAPGSVEVIVDATDNVSGMSDCYLYFFCEETRTSLSCWASLEYYDEQTHTYTHYPDGKLHGTVELDRYTPSGTYRLREVSLYDVAGNGSSYLRGYTGSGDSNSVALPASLEGVRIVVDNPNTPDTTAPWISSMSLSAASATVPGEVDVVASAGDDISGVESIWAYFLCEQTGESISCWLESEYYDTALSAYRSYADGEFRGKLELEDSTLSGTYRLWSVEVRDKAGNTMEYAAYHTDSQEAGRAPLTRFMKELKVTVSNTAAFDTTLPVMNALTVSSRTLTNSGSVEVIVDATDDVAMNYGYVYFTNDTYGNTVSCQVRPNYYDYQEYKYKEYSDGKLHGFLYANDYHPSGAYRLSRVQLYDTSGNSHSYAQDYANFDRPGYSDLPASLKYLRIVYTNSKTPDVTPPRLKNVSLVGTAVEETEPVVRLAGATRYETAFKAADELKAVLGISRFDTVIVASGAGFADALSGSYLAAVKNAPILLVRDNKTAMDQVKEYIKSNLKTGGTVYLLGGVNAVPKAMETGLNGFTVKRLGGNTRYDTNLKILKEAGVAGKDILVCTGGGFADSLSASAAKLPILLVRDGLDDAQKAFLKGTTGTLYVIGGTGAVSTGVEKALKSYGTVKRLGGNTRYETSVLVAQEFFDKPTAAVLAYAQNFPDGLSGGALAAAMDAPLLLTASGKDPVAAQYTKRIGIKTGYVLGGSGLISDKAAKNIFSVLSGDSILKK